MGRLEEYVPKVEALARELGLDYYPVDFEVVPASFMMEVAVYGLPVRMPHWSFGVRWVYQMIQHRMGHSRIFEVVFPGNPNHAYLVDTNSLEENTLVVAHVLGHADFSRNNLSFARSQEQVGYHIVEQAATHAHRIAEAIERHGAPRAERVLDVALALEPHIDPDLPFNREPYRPVPERAAPQVDAFGERYGRLPGNALPPVPVRDKPLHIPPHPERDLLWFIARYAPEMADWERDIFLAVRKESWYFLPVFNCQIMNEGWASYWHSRLLREADFLPAQFYVDCMKTHSDVVSPHASDKQIALRINPYHLGYVMWERLIEERGLTSARELMRTEDDFGFIRNYLTAELADELDLFVYSASRDGAVRVTDANIDQLRETILAPKFNFGAPRVVVEEMSADGSLTLRHQHREDGRGLDAERARHVLEYIERVWHRPVRLITLDGRGEETSLTTRAA